MMAVAYFQMHAPGGFWPLQNKASWQYSIASYFSLFQLQAAASGAWTRLWRRDATPLKADNYARA